MKLKKLAGLISLLCMSPAWAIDSFIVKDIRIEGIQRTEAIGPHGWREAIEEMLTEVGWRLR